ncbi:MAG: hypothetical protein K5663_08525 [Clostridiales bacterium]|nr:hypothetical protein [Clostridiales bacterium]
MYQYSDLGFTFNGRHTYRDFGLIFIPDTPLTEAQTERSEYQLSGVENSVVFSGGVRKPFRYSGNLYPAEDLQGVSRAGELFRRVKAWLKSGRGELILDYDPGVYYLAQVDTEMTYSDKNWFLGGISVSFTCQPGALDRALCVTRASMEAASADFTFILRGEKPADLTVNITNTASTAFTGASVTLDGKSWIISGQGVGRGSTLTVRSEAPADAYRTSSVGEVVSFLPRVIKAERLSAQPGANTVTVTITSSGSVSADVEISARPLY